MSPARLLFAGGGPLEVPRLPELPANVGKVLLRLRAAQLVQHALQPVPLPAGEGHLLGEIALRRLSLAVLLKVPGGVLLGGEQVVQGHLHLRAVRLVVVLGPENALPPLHAVQVGGDELPEDPQADGI